jgi:hypothetical protein
MTRRIREYTEPGLYRILEDGTVDPMGERLNHGYTVRTKRNAIGGDYLPQPGDMFMVYEPPPWGWSAFCTWHSTAGEADEVAVQRNIDFYHDVANADNFDISYEWVDEDDDEDWED